MVKRQCRHLWYLVGWLHCYSNGHASAACTQSLLSCNGDRVPVLRRRTLYIDRIMHTDSWMMSGDVYNALPGAPEYKLDDGWLENRFNRKPSVFTYMRQQRDGSWWDRASAQRHDDQISRPLAPRRRVAAKAHRLSRVAAAA